MSGVCDGGKVVDIVRRLAVSVYCFSSRKKGSMYSDKNQETEVNHLRELVDYLQKENQQLKELLEQAGIDYTSCVEGNVSTRFVSDQGKRILSFAITENATRHFLQGFGAGKMFMRNGA